jgi:5-methylcytosine-specific restriction endonuclease McrA
MSAETKAAWYQKNKELTKERAAQWAKNNPEARTEIVRKSMRKRVSAIRKHQREYIASTPKIRKRRNAYTAQWKRENPEKCRASENKRRTSKSNAGGFFTAEEWFTLCFSVGFKCLCCKEVKPLEADHVVPVSKGGPSWLWNIQPLCKPCNSSKGDKIIDYRV